MILRVGLVSVCALLALAPAQDQPSRFRSSAQAVLVDVQVRDGSRPVPGLTAADFELLDSGIAQTIQAVSVEDVPVSVLLALDVSGSVKGEALAHLKQAARATVEALRAEDQAAVLTFSERVALRSDWTNDRAALTRAIDAVEATGATALSDAIFTALGMRQEAKGRTLLVVFSDGADTSSWMSPGAVMQAAENTDAVVYGVTPSSVLPASGADVMTSPAHLRAELERYFDEQPALFPRLFLRQVARATGGDLLRVSAPRELSGTFARILGDFKTRYLLSFTPRGVPAKGWHPLQVRVKNRNVTVRARPGYSAR